LPSDLQTFEMISPEINIDKLASSENNRERDDSD